MNPSREMTWNYFQNTNREKRRIFVFLLCVSVIASFLPYTAWREEEYHATRRTSAESTSHADNDDATTSDPAIMHTFYHELKEQGQNKLLEVWEDEWSRAGFKTKILTLDDAKKHPYFEEMEKVVKPLFQNGYNAMCFYRWLAMAAAGGGWMSDYDCFPTNFPKEDMKKLPNNGRFTSFEAHVPSLMSGTADEWTRVTKILVDAIPRTDGLKSDMLVFDQVKREGKSEVNFLRPPYNIQRGFAYKSPRKVNCREMHISRAVHVSHYFCDRAFKANIFPLEKFSGTPSENRVEAVKIFLDDWRKQCDGNKEIQVKK